MSQWIAAAVDCAGDRIAVAIDGIQAINLHFGRRSRHSRSSMLHITRSNH
jgi:hypothetical protein